MENSLAGICLKVLGWERMFQNIEFHPRKNQQLNNPENGKNPKRKPTYSNHPFSGNKLLVFFREGMSWGMFHEVRGLHTENRNRSDLFKKTTQFSELFRQVP